MKIFILGYMGAGKTTAGKKLASMLGYSFCDLDQLFEKKHLKTIPVFFSKYGESDFRIKEHELLKEVLSEENLVVSTGGGTPCFYDNMNLMNERGITIYLKLHPKSLYTRLRDAKITRPLLAGIPENKQLQFIENQLKEREHFYNQANIIAKGENLNLKELLQQIKAF